MSAKLKLFEPKSGVLSVQYEPNEHTIIIENPPRFTWMPAQQGEASYRLQIAATEQFEPETTRTIQAIPYNLYTPEAPLEPGRYYWRYTLEADGLQAANWSVIRSFCVDAGLPETPLPQRSARYQSAVDEHPRLWLDQAGVERLREQVRRDAAYCGWDEFMERSVLPWTKKELIAEPARYPNNKRVAKLWRQMYMDCQEMLYAIRHMSIAGVVLQDTDLIEKAKLWLLHAAAWDTGGTTSRDYNDEAAFRIAGALAWGYDWLFDYLTEEERLAVRESLLARTKQVADHVIVRSQIHQVPFDSHAVRSLSSVLVPACIALRGEAPAVQDWLDYTLEYYSCLYTPWGGADGGWAEGPMYWTTGMAFVIDAINLIKNYCGIDFFQRPFFQKTGDFPLYCNSPDTVRASFGDQSTLGEPPSLKTGFNMRQFAGITGNGLYQWYYEQTKKNDKDADTKFYNYGWWDFRFDELVYRHDYSEVESVLPDSGTIEKVKWFRDIGWVAMHKNMDDPSEHIMLLAKSSGYGSISHSHGDQNAFLLHAFGEPLAIESGYYIAFGSTMHTNWRRQTRSVNGLLIDGLGQYAGTNKVLCKEAFGVVEEVRSEAAYSYCRLNATAAYLEHVPYLSNYKREIYFFNDSYIVVVDSVDLQQPAKVEWLLHTQHQMELSASSFKVCGNKADMDVRFVYCSSGEVSLSQHQNFTDVEAGEIEGLDPQWHLHAAAPKAASHRIAALLVPMKKHEPKYVSYFMDDQDHGVHLYFTGGDGKTQKLEIAKAY
ncbi:DUF4962 domain-containing protein [Paenibacillus sp. GXUN7292]|uniref:DUF4962 domain-containing protein n=1 Tax=Paenibacillus sp. GXUN7292 TaxID=3422499 RepID=UPI003D7C4B64